MTEPTVAAETCVALGATGHQFETFPGHDIALGALTVTRVLPVKGFGRTYRRTEVTCREAVRPRTHFPSSRFR